jgi:hypothetical protein
MLRNHRAEMRNRGKKEMLIVSVVATPLYDSVALVTRFFV